jgi:hypothetical protein
MLFHLKVVDPDGPPTARVWALAVISGIGGVVGSYVTLRLTGSTDLLTALVGAFIGGRLVGGISKTVTTRH